MDQLIAANNVPATFTSIADASCGTGTGHYLTYEWEFSTDQGTWTSTSVAWPYDCMNLPECYDKTYTHIFPLNTTTYFRRKATCGSAIAYSNVVTVSIEGQITIQPGSVGYNQSIIYGGLADGFVSLSEATANSSSGQPIQYDWEYSTNNSTWNSIAWLWPVDCGFQMNSDGPSYIHPFYLYQTSYFRRKATCGNKKAYSNVITINVAPALGLQPGSIGYDQHVVYAYAPETFVSIETATCDNAQGSPITYQWEISTDRQQTWTFIENIWLPGCGYEYDARQASYTHIFGITTDTTYFRRKAICGQQTAYSNVVKVISTPPIYIIPGEIGYDQTITIDSKPMPFINITMASGQGPGPSIDSITYSWEYSTDKQTWTALDGTRMDYQYPDNLQVTTYFRRVATRGTTQAPSNVIEVIVAPRKGPLAGGKIG